MYVYLTCTLCGTCSISKYGIHSFKGRGTAVPLVIELETLTAQARLDLILSQLIPLHALHVSLKSLLISSFHLHLLTASPGIQRRRFHLSSRYSLMTSMASQPTSEPYLSSDRRLSAKLVPTFADRGCHVFSAANPHGRNFDFLDRSRYYFFKVAPQLSSQGWVDPFPDSLRWESNPGHLYL
jgi:hypothetical protein